MPFGTGASGTSGNRMDSNVLGKIPVDPRMAGTEHERPFVFWDGFRDEELGEKIGRRDIGEETRARCRDRPANLRQDGSMFSAKPCSKRRVVRRAQKKFLVVVRRRFEVGRSRWNGFAPQEAQALYAFSRRGRKRVGSDRTGSETI